MNPLLFQVISFTLNFLLLVFLLWKLLIPRISAFMDKKQQSIAHSLDETDKNLADVSRELEEVRQELKNSEQQITSLGEEAAKRAQAASQKIAADTEHEIQQLQEKIERQIQQEYHNLHLRLRQELVQQVILQAETLLTQNTDAATQQDLIKNFAYTLENFKEYQS